MKDRDSIRKIYLALGTISLLIGGIFIAVALYAMLEPNPPQQWVYLRPHADTPTPAVAAAAADPNVAPHPLGDQPFRLVIDKIGVDAPVGTFGLDEQAVPQVPYEPDLVAWYNFSAVPGTGSNAVFAGHVTWFGPAVFYDIDQLEAGDQITLRGENGVELIYQVEWNVLRSPDEPNAREVMWETDADVVTLITCGGTFTATGDPVFGGEYDQRTVVRARLVSDAVAVAQDGH